jgi:mRNA interferase HigB
VVISKPVLRDFSTLHPDAAASLERWYLETKQADWPHFDAMRRTFSHADAVGNDRYVFNIRGNRYRLVAMVNFRIRTVFILFVGTHAEYDVVDAATLGMPKGR